MKKIIHLLMAMLFTSFAFAQNDFIIGSDKKTDVDFSEYKSYGWTSQIVDETTASYILNDFVLKNSIRSTIEQEMDGLGYEPSSEPDLLLSFVVFDSTTKFIGYAPTQEQDDYYDYWAGFGSDKTLGQPKEYQFDEGTILIHFVDRKKGEIIWQGYASGVMDNDVFDRNPDNIAEAVELVFEEFDVRADDYREAGR